MPKDFQKLPLGEQRKWMTVFLMTLVTIGIQLYYWYHFNFQTIRYEANITIIPCLALNLLTFYYFKKRDLSKASLVVLIPGTVDLIYLIYFVGGINAPGTFWLSILPFFYGAFMGKRGAICGMIVAFITYIALIVIDLYFDGPKAPYTEVQMYWERIYNLGNYSLILALYFISYTSVFERNNKKLEEQKTMIDNLFRVVLHDITNPISAVKLRMMLLKKKVSSDLVGEILKVEKSVGKVEAIISSLRNFKAIEDGVIEISLSEVSALEVVSDFCSDAIELASNKGISLKQNIQLASKHKILCDPVSLKSQVLMNIFSNALKFSQSGGEVEIKAFTTESQLLIEIKDFGCGIPPQILKNLFRFDKPTSRMGTDGEQGTGYGLPIMKYFTEYMGGFVEVESKEATESITSNHGTKFTLSFNLVLES